MLTQKATRFSIILFLLFATILYASANAQGSGNSDVPPGPSAQCNTDFAGGSGSGGSSTIISNALNSNASSIALSASLIGLIISFDVIGIGYLISKLVPATNVRNWLTSEYWEFTKSLILVAVIFSVITFVSSVGVILGGAAQSLPNGGTPGTYGNNLLALYSGAENYLCIVNNEANLSIRSVVPFLFEVSLLQSVKIGYAGFPVFVPGFVQSPVFRSGISFNIFQSFLINVQIIYLGQGLSLFIDFIMFLLVPIKVFFSTQIVILPYMIMLGLTLLLPVGLILRSLPFTRGVGGTIIAFGIGIAVIWPSILILFNAPVSSYFCSILQPNFCTLLGPTGPPNNIIVNGNQYTCPSGNFFNYFCTSLSQYQILPANNFALAWESLDSIYPSLNLLIKFNLYLIMQFFVLFVLDLMIFYALTDNIAKMLGGSIKLSLGRKLKLV